MEAAPKGCSRVIELPTHHIYAQTVIHKRTLRQHRDSAVNSLRQAIEAHGGVFSGWATSPAYDGRSVVIKGSGEIPVTDGALK